MITYPISHFGGKREKDELVVYTGTGTTETNKYGFEITVEKGLVVAYGGNNSKIPENDGFILSAHGEAALFLADIICIGAEVKIDTSRKYIEIAINDDSRKAHFQREIELIKERIQLLNKENQEYHRDKTDLLLKEAEECIGSKDFGRIKAILEECYCLTSLSYPDEIRGVWHRPLETNDKEVEATICRFAEAGFNLILVETNYGGFANALKCAWEGLPPRSDYDVIEAFIRIGKSYGMEIHAWFENYFIGHTGAKCAMLEIKPEWIAKRKDGDIRLDGEDKFYFLNAAMEEVRDYLTDSCRRLLDNYDFDGLQLDYIRYPFIRDIRHAAGFDDYTKKTFLEETGIDIDTIQSIDRPEWLSFTQWCAKQVTEYVGRVHSLIKEYENKGRRIQLTTAVIGNPTDAIHKKCQDWGYWVQSGWLDSIYPMAYYNDATEVFSEVSHMVANYGEAPNISGISPLYNNLPNIEVTKQIEACRKAGAKGVAVFDTRSFNDECLQALKNGVFRKK